MLKFARRSRARLKKKPPADSTRILIVSDAWHPQVNGVVRTYEHLEEELTGMGYDVKIIGPGDFPRSYPMPGYNEIRLVPFPYHRLRWMIEDFSPDVLHIATEGPLGWAARRYARNYEQDFTSCLHTKFPDYARARVPKYLPFLKTPIEKAGIFLIRTFHKPSACMFAATKTLREEIERWKFTCPVKPMTRGVDHELFYPGEKNLFRDLKGPIALYVGRVAVEKNIEAFLSMAWEGTKVVVGDGPALPHLKKKYNDAVFTGRKEGKDLADCFRSADVFVFPSKTDTFGMVLVEAMACGLPIAAYPVTGPIDIVTEAFLGAVNHDLATAAREALRHGTAEHRAAHAKNTYNWPLAARQFLETD